MYETYSQRYEQARQMLENVHPVQDFCNIVLETEKKTIATASHMYENASVTATNMAANAYDTLIGTGSNMDKQLAALGYATQQQLSELSTMTQQQLVDAWNTVMAMKERLEKAASWSAQTKRIKQQLKGYRMVLSRMRDMSSSVPSKQMAKMMRTITECNETMEKLESRAMEAFFMGTGFLRKSLMSSTQVPKRYAKYSSDPLLGVSTYPLGFHLFVLAATELPLRILMKNRGFTRLSMGPVAYYFHPGASNNDETMDDGNTPIVFVHGIGIGLIVYLPLIDQLLKTGRPIFCPEIPYVSGFRPWQSPNSILPPAVVCSILTEMLAKHGHWKGSFCGHSYGTTWLSYMCKYAPHAIVAACFLDPVCFCLHMPRLTKQFVYHRPDPGTVAYMVRTDVMVSWTIQRCFPWARIALFAEQISIPCAVFLSDGDMLVPSATVEQYLRSKGSPCCDFGEATPEHFASSDLTVTIFRGDVHGGWTERSETCPMIGKCVEVLCERAEGKSNRKVS
jgi:pimeloyl-ACP methyl ester carboxylesterase